MRELGEMPLTILFFYAIQRSQLAFRIRLGYVGPFFFQFLWLSLLKKASLYINTPGSLFIAAW